MNFSDYVDSDSVDSYDMDNLDKSDYNMEDDASPKIAGNEHTQNDVEHENSDKYKVILDLTKEDIDVMEWSNAEDAYRFYFTYAKCHGFMIRRHNVRRGDSNQIIMKEFVCSKAGLRDKRHLMRDDRKKEHRPLTRTNCKAKLRVRLDKNRSKWKVSSFQECHNHQLCKPNFIPLLPAYRGLTVADKAQVNLLHSQGVRTCHIMGYMMDQKGGYMNVGFNKKDLSNYIERQKLAKIKDGDLLATVSYLQGKADNDAMFYSRYKVTGDDKLSHLFWADGTSRCDYQCFGDVVAFDSTYKKNKYNKPLVIFSGKNHHSQTVVFGCAIVADESAESYKWVLNTFLDAMCNKHPTAVVTDGESAMRKAIKIVFPNASHRLCAWHLSKNALDNIKDSAFLRDFKRAIYGNFTPECFEKYWENLVSKHQLKENIWVSQVYKKRHIWATAFLRDKFFAGLRTTSLCEGINSVIKIYVRRKNTVLELLSNFEHALRDYRSNEWNSDFSSLYTEPVLTTSLPKIERHASQIFTRNVFKQVRAQIVIAGGLNVIKRDEDIEKVIFGVEKSNERLGEHVVVLHKDQCKYACTCKQYEYSGIPCCHIICAMRLEHVHEFPTSLICKRWCKDAKSAFISSYQPHNMNDNMLFTARFGVLAGHCNRLCHNAAKKHETFNLFRNEILNLTTKLEQHGEVSDMYGLNDVCDPIVVKTNGSSKRKTSKKKDVHCSACKNKGHRITTCPLLLSTDDDEYNFSDFHDTKYSDEESLFSQSCTENGKHVHKDFIDFACVDITNTRSKGKKPIKTEERKDKKPIKTKEIMSLKRKSDRSLPNFRNKDIENGIALEDPETASPKQLLPFPLLHSTSASSAQQLTFVSGLNMVPPRNNMPFNISSSPYGIYSPPMYGVLPMYPHLPSSSVVPVPNSMSYGALLQQVTNPSYFSQIVGSSSLKKNMQQQ